MAKNAFLKLFEAGDGRTVSSPILFISKGEHVELVSNGWPCEDDASCDEIIVYKFLHYPSDQKCEDAVLVKWTKDVEVQPLCQVEVSRIILAKNNKDDIIDEPGQYLLVRECGAEDVDVYAKFRESC